MSITQESIEFAQNRTHDMLKKAGFILTDNERKNIEIADFGLNNLVEEGLQLITYINNDYYCAKELVMFPKQTCPEHKHPPVGNKPGKIETFRCRWGRVLLYIEGEPAKEMKGEIPSTSKKYYTVFYEIELLPGEQYTIPSNTLHWFQAGEEGAIVSEFSTTSRDEYDVFTDPSIVRVP